MPEKETFEIMADWKSFEITHWLQTTTPAAARALFETGAELEKRNKLLEDARKAAAAFMNQNTTSNRFALRNALEKLKT